jgi:hypothetical protein
MDRHPKEVLHDAIQASLQDPRTAQSIEGSVLTRWVLVAEVALPDERTGLAVISSTAGNVDMTSWDRAGFLISGLFRALFGEGR